MRVSAYFMRRSRGCEIVLGSVLIVKWKYIRSNINVENSFIHDKPPIFYKNHTNMLNLNKNEHINNTAQIILK